ncbi:unnamed protein product [Cuscuta epithymum]|uniref:Uncharacterized protein n=1 Tax=Cuscuta epithymum TaxID=186058 RepID=A0AAV0FJ69_9ASTE|nr:unnamed protein product [Cuscuta epithymum]
MKSEIDGMHRELDETRREFEHEKKENKWIIEQNKAMKKNLVSVACEIERLRAEQMAANRRARGIGVGPYGMLNGSVDVGYSDSFYGGDPYHTGGWGPYDRRGPPR